MRVSTQDPVTFLKCVPSYPCSAQYLHISLWVKYKALGRNFKVLHNLKPSSHFLWPHHPPFCLAALLLSVDSTLCQMSPPLRHLALAVCSAWHPQPQGQHCGLISRSSFKCFVEDVFSDHLYKLKSCSSASLSCYILFLHSTHYHLTYHLLLDIYWLVDPTKR